MIRCHDCKQTGFTVLLVLTDSKGEFKVCRECWKKREDAE